MTRKARDVSKHEQLADELRHAITSGDLPPGAQMPSELALTAAHGVSRTTAQAALAALTNEGLIVTRGREGRFVRSHTTITWDMTRREPGTDRWQAADPWPSSVTLDGDAAGFVGHQEVNVRLLQGDKTVAGRPLRELLSLGPDGMVLCRDHLRMVDAVPQALAATYMTYAVVQGCTQVMADEDIDGDGIDAALAGLGYARTHSTDVLNARQPTQEEVRLLQLPAGTPVLELLRVSQYGDDDRPLVADYSVFQGMANLVKYELPA